MANGRKAFHFDLDEAALRRYYPSERETGYKAVWGKIQAFMEANGFKHTQYSGYESTHGMSYVQAYKVLEDLQRTYPWFMNCARVATLTEIGRRHDVLRHLEQMDKDVADGSEAPSPEQRSPSLHGQEADTRRSAQALTDAARIEMPQRPDRDREP